MDPLGYGYPEKVKVFDAFQQVAEQSRVVSTTKSLKMVLTAKVVIEL